MSAKNGAAPDSAVTEIEGQRFVGVRRDGNFSKPKSKSAQQSWRDVLPVHPAADLFPMMARDDLLALGKDIKDNDLLTPVVLIQVDKSPVKVKGKPVALLDGRNRLDALETIGCEIDLDGSVWHADKDKVAAATVYLTVLDQYADAYAYVISANIKRRHLKPEDKDRLIAEVLKARPEQSNRTVAKQLKSSHKKVGKVRAKLESTGALPQLEKTTGADGKKRSAKRKPAEQRVFDSPQPARPATQTIEALRARAKALGYRLAKRGDYRLIDSDGGTTGGFTDLEAISKHLDGIQAVKDGKAEWLIFSPCGMPMNDAAHQAVAAGKTADDICGVGDADAEHEEGLRVIAARGFLNRAAEAKDLASIDKLRDSDVTEGMIQAAVDVVTVWDAVARNLRLMVEAAA